MGYNRYIYSDATLKAKAANNKAGLLKNKKRSDIVATEPSSYSVKLNTNRRVIWNMVHTGGR